MNILEEFDFRRTPLKNLSFRDAADRLQAFRKWMLETPQTRAIHDQLRREVPTVPLFRHESDNEMSIRASTPYEIAAVGLDFVQVLADGTMDAATLPMRYQIRPPRPTNSAQAYFDELVRRYIDPALDYLRRELVRSTPTLPSPANAIAGPTAPVEITESLARFRKEFPEPKKVAFVMMDFGRTRAHDEITKAIRATLASVGLTALRADDRGYHEDLFLNVVTYMHGCGFGIAVFEHIEAEQFNPNVALEVGYMQALRKPVCLLKDRTLRTLQIDLVAKLYCAFDPQSAGTSIPTELGRWLRDKGLSSEAAHNLPR